eukprot:5442330-Prymnesium_polylepis.2
MRRCALCGRCSVTVGVLHRKCSAPPAAVQATLVNCEKLDRTRGRVMGRVRCGGWGTLGGGLKNGYSVYSLGTAVTGKTAHRTPPVERGGPGRSENRLAYAVLRKPRRSTRGTGSAVTHYYETAAISSAHGRSRPRPSTRKGGRKAPLKAAERPLSPAPSHDSER